MSTLLITGIYVVVDYMAIIESQIHSNLVKSIATE